MGAAYDACAMKIQFAPVFARCRPSPRTSGWSNRLDTRAGGLEAVAPGAGRERPTIRLSFSPSVALPTWSLTEPLAASSKTTAISCGLAIDAGGADGGGGAHATQKRRPRARDGKRVHGNSRQGIAKRRVSQIWIFSAGQLRSAVGPVSSEAPAPAKSWPRAMHAEKVVIAAIAQAQRPPSSYRGSG